MKINIAIISPSSGIGGGDRKFRIYYKYLDTKYVNKYLIFLEKGNKIKKTDKGYFVGKEKLIQFLKKKNILFTYVSPQVDKKLFEKIKKINTILWNVNFTTIHKEEENVLNLVISKTDYWKIRWLKRRPLQNTYVVYNPIDYSLWTQLAKTTKQKYRSFFKNKNIKYIIGRLGRAEPTKWHWLIISSLLLLQRKKEYSYGFIFAGIPLLYRQTLNILLNKKMKERILYLPELISHKSIAEFYSSIDIFWQASWVGESFGNVIAESFCFEVPVITDYKSFLRKNGRVQTHKYDAQIEVVDQGKNGWVAKYPKIMIQTLKQINKKKVKLFGMNGKEKVKEIYDARFAGRTIINTLFEVKKLKPPYKTSTPTVKETIIFGKEYKKRINKAKQANKISIKNKIEFYCIEHLWHGIELIYTLKRKILRKIGIDIEWRK